MRNAAILAFALLNGCTPNAVANNSADAKPAEVRATKPIEGFRDLKLGISFEQAIGLTDSQLFNPASTKRCFDDLPLKGCTLFTRDDDAVYEMRNGIPYGLRLSFNRFDHLTDIGLKYQRQTGVAPAQCLLVLGRTVDWVTQEYGSMKDRDLAEADGTVIMHRSQEGNDFATFKPSAEGSYTSDFLYSGRWQKQIVKGVQHWSHPERHVTIFSSYIVIPERTICEVEVTFAEPDRVERPSYD